MASAASKLSATLVAASLITLPTAASGQGPAADPAEESEAAGASDRETVALEPLEVEGKLRKGLDEKLNERLVEGLERGELMVVDDASAATFVLHAKVTYAKPDYQIALELRQVGDDGEPIATAERTCDLCGAQELEELAADLSATIARKAEQRVELETKLLVASQPPGASVWVDGTPVGETPLELDVEPGDHEVSVRLEGYQPRSHQLSFEEGERESLSVTLEAEGPDRRSRTFRILGWTGVGAGIGAMGAGVALLVIHDQPITSVCSGDDVDDDGDCHFVHKTLPGGIALAAAGAAALGTGIALLILDRKRTKAKRVEAMIGPGSFGVRGRF
jgi:hypothetical protein